MEDHVIVEMYWRRNPEAIRETAKAYGPYCKTIARNILHDARDAEECVNDTWLGTWNAIPENRPTLLAPFLGKITRNLAFNRYKSARAEKRGGGEFPLVLEELSECVSANDTVQTLEAAELGQAVSRFLYTLPERDCNVFLRRYWFGEPLAKIAGRYGMRENSVKTCLYRSREKLRQYLEKEEVL
ncbi:sigma-70 family RNA polymerase sigma factor [uncultured Oscillibacter sp.]|uniref:RNA polymerase sigma factor n=1 Tax=uncultured Oscillibacter sp. TaxID=876091 RepID=UPI002638E0E6|nr:sigma-70 family RNA polymerase sigma factor [uncultured Oscillibacter sp.]